MIEDPQLDEGRRGFVQALQDAGLAPDRDFVLVYRCAQGDQTLLPTIVQGFVAEGVSLIATSTTPCMIAAARGTSAMSNPPPVVITIVSPPEQVGVAPVPANLTGFYSLNDMDEFLRVIVSCLPGPVRRIGLLTNPSEPNAELAADALKKACQRAQVELVSAPVSSLGDVPDAAMSLADRGVQAFVAAADNTVYNAMPFLAKTAEQCKIPVFTAEAGIAKAGAAVGWGLDYFDWGYQSGSVAAQLLRGKPIGGLPLRPCTRYQLYFNQDACAKQGLTITPDMRRRATKIM